MGEEQRQGGGQEVEDDLDGTDPLAKAVEVSEVSRLDFTLWEAWAFCDSLQRTGCVMAWLIVTGSVTSGHLNSKLLKTLFDSGAWPRADHRRSALPLRMGEFETLVNWLKSCSLAEAVRIDNVGRWCDEAWSYVACFACNSLLNVNRPLAAGGWSVLERRMANAIRLSVTKLTCHGQAAEFCVESLEKELRGKRVNYQGEEVGTCEKLTLCQVLPALPPKEHGGCIDVLDFVSQGTRRLLKNPESCLLPDDGREIPKLQGRIHVEKDDLLPLCRELVERGVCEWIDYSAVVRYRNQPVLNGLFGVKKQAVVNDGRPVLRLIMNLVPSNSILLQLQGGTNNLPMITAWMSTVLEGNEELSIWQSDMSNAFYLFRIPAAWLGYLAFNVIFEPSVPGFQGEEKKVLACRVLPMGWLSSVAIMQEVSERILLERQLEFESQIVRRRPVPLWMTGLLKEARRDNRAWWHVYLDNFAAGQIHSPTEELRGGHRLHQLAEQAWNEVGVVSSEKKKVTAAQCAQELGANLDGKQKTLGASPDRFLKLIHVTLLVITRPQLSKRLVQVIAGRWVHVLQFRRAGMSFLDLTWKFINSKKFNLKLVNSVRRELFHCVCAIPLLHTELDAKVSKVTTASDASMTGGAVGIARSLSAAGKSFVRNVTAADKFVPRIPVIVVSLFNGIGGAFRCYDVLGVAPLAMIAFDIHKPANRVTSRRWPHVLIYGDVRSIDEDMVKSWLLKFPEAEEIHMWGGFPCNDLSSAKAYREELEGKDSSLFFEIPRVFQLIRSVAGKYIVVKLAAENVASMSKPACQQISKILKLRPYYLDCSDAVPMNRPRLCWCTEDMQNVVDGVFCEDEEYWTRIYARNNYPLIEQWLSDGWVWPGAEWGVTLPTCMKSIVRARPPPQPAGIDRCKVDAIGRWTADSYRYPPYQYREQFVLWHREKETWRLVDSSERELLMGYGFQHTRLCMSESEAKQSRQKLEDERCSLVGDSFSIFSFVIVAAALCFKFIPRVDYSHLCGRMGMTPGFVCPPRLRAPLQRDFCYGLIRGSLEAPVEDLNRILLGKVNHTGSDVKITTGELINPKAICQQSISAAWWDWSASFKVRWKHKEHINVLELRAILLSVKYHISHLKASHARIFHITDSYVSMSVVGKGRTSSQRLGKVLKELNAHLVAFGLWIVVAHVESGDNPTDGASRSMEILH